KEHLYGYSSQAQSEDASELQSGGQLRDGAPEITTHEKAQGQGRYKFQVDVARVVILPERQGADGEKQSRKRGSLSALLIHAVAIDQDRNQEDGASQTDHPGNDSDDSSYCEGNEQIHGSLHFFLDSVGERAYTS